MSLVENTTDAATNPDRVLLYLAAHDGEDIDIGVIADALDVASVEIADALNELSARGWIERLDSEAESRIISARVTSAGVKRATADAPTQVVSAIRQLLDSVAR